MPWYYSYMKSSVRIPIILGIFFGTIFITKIIGDALQAKTHDVSGLTSGGVFISGVFGAVASLVMGIIVSFLLRRKTTGFYSLLGYIIPSLATILYNLYYLLRS